MGALVVVGVLGALGVRWWLGPQVTTESMLRRDFVQTIVTSGHVEAPHRVGVGAQITGKVLLRQDHRGCRWAARRLAEPQSDRPNG